MAYLDIHNNTLSGNTFRLYLSDYGKFTLASTGSLYHSIEKFGLSDRDIDYRRFTTGGTCQSESGLSALSSSCFYDLPDSRGGELTTMSGGIVTYGSVMVGPRYEIQTGLSKLLNTSLGVAPQPSNIWLKYNARNRPTEIEQPDSGMFNTCWKLGHSVVSFFPSFCWTCADFNHDGEIDGDDLKIFLNLMGNEKDGTQQLVGDFNGDGLVDMEDFNTFINCMKHSGKDIMDFCVDKEVFCLLCEHLGKDSPCNGDCIGCI